MKSERKQISLKMLTWHRIRALANAEPHDCFMGDMMARIVDEWCKANDWRFTGSYSPVGSDDLTAICDQISLDVPAPAR